METYNQDPSGGMVAALIGVLLIPMLIVWVISIAGLWKIYEKAGKPGWAAIVPIYNIIVLLEIVGKPTWWLIMLIIPCVNIIFAVWMTNLLSKSFGQSEGFTVGFIFLPFIFYPLLGFGNYRYLGPAGAGAGFQSFTPYDPSANYKDPFNPPQV